MHAVPHRGRPSQLPSPCLRRLVETAGDETKRYTSERLGILFYIEPLIVSIVQQDPRPSSRHNDSSDNICRGHRLVPTWDRRAHAGAQPCRMNSSGAGIHEKYSSRTFPRLPIQGHRRFGLMRVFGSSRHPLRASSISSLQTFRASCSTHAHATMCVSMRSAAINSDGWQHSDSRRCRCAAGLQTAPSRAREAGGR